MGHPKRVRQWVANALVEQTRTFGSTNDLAVIPRPIGGEDLAVAATRIVPAEHCGAGGAVEPDRGARDQVHE